MKEDLGNNRKAYQKSKLSEDSISENPMELFRKWYYEVEANPRIDETNAMTLATKGLDGFPKARTVLLKKYTYDHFLWDVIIDKYVKLYKTIIAA